MFVYRNTSLPTHGQGALYAFGLYRESRWGRGIRLSIGGYGWNRPKLRPHFTRYRRVATHFGIGPVTISIVHSRLQ